MLKNYLTIAMRNLAKSKGYTVINILGLAVGIACCILVMLFVRSEWSFDRFHIKSERMYRAWLQEYYKGEIFNSQATPVPLGPVLSAEIPEVEATCRVASLRPLIKQGATTFTEQAAMADSNFFAVFDFELINGNRHTALAAANSIILTQSIAKKYFGSANPMGSSLEIKLGDKQVLFTVSAIMKDLPVESSIQFGMLFSFSNAHYIWSEDIRTKAWSNVSVQTYVLLHKEAEAIAVQQKIAGIMNPRVAADYKPGEYRVGLQPIADVHFNTTLPEGVESASDPKYAYILATIGLFILLIACVNFVTLSVGRSTTRALEVGVRKVLGAGRKQLVVQFWSESLLLVFVSVLIGIGLAYILLRPFNELANRELALVPDAFTIFFSLLIFCVIGLLAGMYPAIVLSRFKPIQVLKGRLSSGNGLVLFRRVLVIGQFVASIIMIIASFSVQKQLQYLQSKDLGYNREHLVVVETNLARREGVPLAARFKNALAGKPQVVNSTISLFSMAEYGWMKLGYTDKQNVFRRFHFNAVDADFIDAMNLKITKGRKFLASNAGDSNHIIVNEALVREYGWKDPIGQKLPGAYEQEIIGVVQDFNIETLHAPINPAVIALKPDSVFAQSTDVTSSFSSRPRITVRFREGNVDEHISLLRAAWKTVAGDQDFEYTFLDDALARAYEQEQRLGNIVQYASILSIFIACMGLFGLTTLVVVRRTKEIGIRKVLGADVSSVVTLLSRDFVVMVLIASLVAFPVAWWALSGWLQDFAYRIDMPLWVFFAAALLTLLVALATVSIQAVKAALANPVKSLRTE